MSPQVIPLVATPSQVVHVALGAQVCKLKVFAKQIQVPVRAPGTLASDPPAYEGITPVFLDLYVNDAPIIYGALGLHAVGLVRDAYLGFLGELAFLDTQGIEDPQYTGLGARWLLTYWPPS